ncbi:hypothetical protein BGC31_12070 [Komagataeibacter xylinus]|nr:hypothetical protein BGC31_12070 [Komagataeibacter xylinus]RFP07745.1 hypothetical protein BFX83_08395 [Komagataeibacter xylinus]
MVPGKYPCWPPQTIDQIMACRIQHPNIKKNATDRMALQDQQGLMPFPDLPVNRLMPAGRGNE